MNLSTITGFYSPISRQSPFKIEIPDIHLCYCSFSTNNFDDSIYEQSGIELPSHLNSAITKRKAEYLAGRICAKEALAVLNIKGYPTAQQNKNPLWPDFSCGSITHSHRLAAAIVAHKKHWLSLGLDVECLLSETRSKRLISSIMNEKEQQFINKDFALFTTIAFSIKESLFKALYPLTQKYFYFKHAEIIDWNAHGEVTLKLLIDLSAQWQTGTLVKGYYCQKENYIWSMIGIKN